MLIHVLRSSYLDLTLKIRFWLLKHSIMFVDYQYSIRKECIGVEGIKEYGFDKLIQVAASQLSDQLPESREATRTLLLELQTVYEKSHGLSTVVSENPEMGSSENFFLSKLSPLSAQAVLRVTTNIAREGLVIGS
ncbi:hypothetical protein V6Z11_D01G179700 [Gossypium hirsutum]